MKVKKVGVQVCSMYVFKWWGESAPPLVGIGLTDLPKIRGGWPPAPPPLPSSGITAL